MGNIPPIIHSSWHEHLEPLFNDNKMNLLKDDILPQQKFYPESKDIFRVFSMSLDQIKVVVLGQDPYPRGEGIGLAFAVKNTVAIPPSLKIIFRETASTIPNAKVDRTLQHWVEQGVFLLNTALTVEAGDAGSHLGYWRWFTEKVVEIISLRDNPPVWLLWGAKAQAFRSLIHASVPITLRDTEMDKIVEEENYCLLAAHPAAEGYNSQVINKFTGCNHFKICNDILKLKGQAPIAW